MLHRPLSGLTLVFLAACGGAGGGSDLAVTPPEFNFAATVDISTGNLRFTQNGRDYDLEAGIPDDGDPTDTFRGWTGGTAGPTFGFYQRGDAYVAAAGIDIENTDPITGISGHINTSPGTGTATYDGSMRFVTASSSESKDIMLSVDFDGMMVTSASPDITLTGTITDGVIAGPMTVTNLSTTGDTTGDFDGGFFGDGEVGGVYQSTDGTVTGALGADRMPPP